MGSSINGGAFNLKERLFQTIDGVREELIAMADDIFDHPETGMEEFHALDVLTQ